MKVSWEAIETKKNCKTCKDIGCHFHPGKKKDCKRCPRKGVIACKVCDNPTHYQCKEWRGAKR